ncbi:hypothetical protein VTK56DRAFT_5485 [Thermocarpiscus australiensis]
MSNHSSSPSSLFPLTVMPFESVGFLHILKLHELTLEAQVLRNALSRASLVLAVAEHWNPVRVQSDTQGEKTTGQLTLRRTHHRTGYLNTSSHSGAALQRRCRVNSLARYRIYASPDPGTNISHFDCQYLVDITIEPQSTSRSIKSYSIGLLLLRLSCPLYRPFIYLQKTQLQGGNYEPQWQPGSSADPSTLEDR